METCTRPTPCGQRVLPGKTHEVNAAPQGDGCPNRADTHPHPVQVDSPATSTPMQADGCSARSPAGSTAGDHGTEKPGGAVDSGTRNEVCRVDQTESAVGERYLRHFPNYKV